MSMSITEKKIIRQINSWIKEHSTLYVEFSNWYIGVTNDPQSRELSHRQKASTQYWVCFNARSKKIALLIETWGHSKGMLETDKKGGVRENTKFVYIYKKHGNIVDQLT
jgi:hypothetical protein